MKYNIHVPTQTVKSLYSKRMNMKVSDSLLRQSLRKQCACDSMFIYNTFEIARLCYTVSKEYQYITIYLGI